MTDSIFDPQFQVTERIRLTLDDIERQSWLIENMLLMPKYETWIQREVHIKRASGTTRIEGAQLDEKAVAHLQKRGFGGQLSDDERANINALDAYEFVNYLSEQQDIPIDELVVRELNRQFIRGFDRTLTPGVYRKGQNTVGGYSPPDQGDVPGLMRSFSLWLRQDDSDLHPVLKAGLAHIHLVAIHPFWDGNGRTARGLSTLVLQRSKWGFRKLLSSEASLFTIQGEYFRAIERTLGRGFSRDYDATLWLEFFTGALKNDADSLVQVLSEWHRLAGELHEQLEQDGVSARQADAIFFTSFTGQITRSDYVEIARVSPATASRDLDHLLKIGYLIAEGKTRNRVYRLVRPEHRPEPKSDETQLTLPEIP